MSAALILAAADFAAVRHRDQRRKGEHAWPYINHPLRVAELLSRVGGVDDPEIIAAALLHDTVEDTGTLPEEIARRFGERVRDLVLEVSDDKRLEARERKRQQVARAPRLSPGATLIKVADKIANVGDIARSPPAGWSLERRRSYLRWAEEVVAACPSTSAALEALFHQTVAQAREGLERAGP